MDFLILTNIFDSEKEVEGELNASSQHKNRGIMINNAPMRNPKQIFLPDIHILPNKLSVVQTKRKIFVIQWIDDFELSQARFKNILDISNVRLDLTCIETMKNLGESESYLQMLLLFQKIDDFRVDDFGITCFFFRMK